MNKQLTEYFKGFIPFLSVLGIVWIALIFFFYIVGATIPQTNVQAYGFLIVMVFGTVYTFLGPVGSVFFVILPIGVCLFQVAVGFKNRIHHGSWTGISSPKTKETDIVSDYKTIIDRVRDSDN